MASLLPSSSSEESCSLFLFIFFSFFLSRAVSSSSSSPSEASMSKNSDILAATRAETETGTLQTGGWCYAVANTCLICRSSRAINFSVGFFKF